MGLDPKEVRDLIMRPVLEVLQLPSPSASERLLMGTVAQESGFGHLKQVGGGPAIGLCQMEPATFNDLFYRFLKSSRMAPLRARLQGFIIDELDPLDQLKGNLYFSVAMCRVHYYSKPFTLRDTADVEDLAYLYKRHYNTPLGAATEAQFIRNYAKYVAPIYRGNK